MSQRATTLTIALLCLLLALSLLASAALAATYEPSADNRPAFTPHEPEEDEGVIPDNQPLLIPPKAEKETE